MKQGDVYWYTFGAPDKRRPVLILTRNPAPSFLASVTVAPLTNRIRSISTEVVLTPEEDGVLTELTECAVNVDNIQTVRKARLDEYLTSLSLNRLREVRTAIEFAFGFDRL